MCGIAGVFVAEAAGLDARSVIDRMQMKLTHRGPDDRGVVVSDSGRCALAHTRLAILDLTPAGHQPMGLGEWGAGSREQGAGSRRTEGRDQRSDVRDQRSAITGHRSSVGNERYWIVFNGEIYNYRELREQLGGQTSEVSGHRSPVSGPRSEVGDQRSAVSGLPSSVDFAWQSNSDTEVILRAYERWGIECVQKLRGMFAFAIWDSKEEKLILARDPFGIKPLYYYHADGLFLFASEVRALLASNLVPRKLSADGLRSYLEFGSVQDPLTMIHGVRALMPGHLLAVDRRDGQLRLEEAPYTNTLNGLTTSSPISNHYEAVTELRRILEESVRMHLVSDVPVGAFLSGGIDSSAIVGLMSRVAGKTPRTFSVVFDESDFSEAAHAKLVARAFGTEHREILLSEETLLGLLPGAMESMDQPTMDGINTYVISKAVKDSGVTVALSGLGGDELFAGYPSFRRARQLKQLSAIPATVRRAMARSGKALLPDRVQYRKALDLLAGSGDAGDVYRTSRQLFASTEVSHLMTDLRPQHSDLESSTPCSLLDADPINAMSLCELSGYMANTLLRDTDQMSMAHALEVRVPFIDPTVVSFVLGLPGKWKLNGGRPKPLLLDAVADLLPEEIWRRRKMGFVLPFERWMHGVLRSELDWALCSRDGLTTLGLGLESTRAVWKTFNKHPRHERWSRPWALYVLKKWCEVNGITA